MEQFPSENTRVESWRTLSTPDWNGTLLGDATRHESLRYGPAELTDLGAKLLGRDLWHPGNPERAAGE